MDGDGGVVSAAVEALWLALRVAGLPLAAMLAVGLAVSVLQALVLLLSGPAIGGAMRAYADDLLSRIVAAGGTP